MANRVGGDFFEDFASVAKTAATPQELREIVAALQRVQASLDPESELHNRVGKIKAAVDSGRYGTVAASKLKIVVAALVKAADNAGWVQDKDGWCQECGHNKPLNAKYLCQKCFQSAKKTSSFKLTSSFVQTAAITVSQGQDDQGFHMLVNMNGREYVLRGSDADNFRKEYAAIPKPEAKVNDLVMKYMNQLKPYSQAKIPVAPGVQEKAQQVDRAQGLADADNYLQGKGVPTEQENKRYMTTHASDKTAEILGVKPKPRDTENKGQAPEFEPLTGSLDKEATTWDGEFSDIGGASADLSKMGAGDIQPGDRVRVSRGAGSFMWGEAEEVTPEGILVKGRVYPLDAVKTEEEVEGEKERGKREWQEEDEALDEAAKQKKRDERINNSVSVKNPTGSAAVMVPELQRRNYSLTLKYKAPQYLTQAEQEWADWTGGEQLSDECAKQYDTMYGREWTLTYSDPERSMPVFFEIDPMGTHEGKRSPKPIGLSQRDKVIVNYPEIISQLVKAGLRMQCGGSTQELRASMNNTKKACGDSCAQVDEEVVLPAAIEVEGQGGKSLPPADTKPTAEQIETVVTDKEAGFNFFFPGQVLKEFYPELQHETVDYPNDNNSPMIEDIDLDSALNVPILGHVPKTSYVSTSPAAGAGIGRDGKEQVLEGAPLRNESDIRGGMFMDEFHQQYEGVPGALLAVASKVAAKDEKGQFNQFMKYVCAEIAATMVAAFKVTSRPILNQTPGVGEVQLAQVEQPSSLSSFNIVNTGSRVKYLLEKLNDGDIKDAINSARAQAAVWVDDPSGGFVYEVFVRAESIDTDSMIMKYTFITGTKESE